MKGTRLFCFLLVLQIVSLVSLVVVAMRPLSSTDGMSNPAGLEDSPAPKFSPQYTTKSEKGSMVNERMSEIMQEANERGVSKIGSSPPNCEHKCYGCTPCQAIQVPSNNRRQSHLGTLYANYEPESWKCKCGPSFYTP